MPSSGTEKQQLYRHQIKYHLCGLPCDELGQQLQLDVFLRKAKLGSRCC